MIDSNNQDSQEILGEVLSQVAYQIREILGGSPSALQRMAPPHLRDENAALDGDAALVMQTFYRLLHLAGNLEGVRELDALPYPILTNDDIVGFVRTVVERAKLGAELQGLELEFQCDMLSHIIEMDAARIERMILNLLSNAFKFTPRGGKVSVTVRVEGKMVEIRVHDTGVGIPQEKLEKIFDRCRPPAVPDGSPTGMGFGLLIARKIAEDHGGSLVVFSRENEGTLVVASLSNRRSTVIRMNSGIIADYSGGFNQTLLELSDAVPKEAFQNKMMD